MRDVVGAPDERAQLGVDVGEPRLTTRLANWRRERVVMGEDLSLEFAQLGAGLEAELVGQDVTDPLERSQAVRLSTAAVEGEHELRPEAFAQRVVVNEAFELGDGGVMAATREIGVDAVLHRREVQLFEPDAIGLRELVEGEL